MSPASLLVSVDQRTFSVSSSLFHFFLPLADEVDLLFELLDADADGQLKLEEAITTYDSPTGSMRNKALLQGLQGAAEADAAGGSEQVTSNLSSGPGRPATGNGAGLENRHGDGPAGHSHAGATGPPSSHADPGDGRQLR